MIRRVLVLIALTVALNATASGQPTCPSDLSSLDSQIQTQALRGQTRSIDEHIQDAGSLAEALARAIRARNTLTAARNGLPAAAPQERRQSLDDMILITNAEVAALQCRQGQN